MTEAFAMGCVLVFLVIIAMVGIWGNWMWLGKDGFSLDRKYVPGFFKFWFSYFPRWAIGCKTGMEDVEL